MLTNLASYLLGYLEPAPAPAALDSAAQRLSGAVDPTPATLAGPSAPSVLPSATSTDDEEWLLVNAVGMEDEENVSVVRISRSASMSSLPCCQAMEESWFLTPPPCFTSTAPSPLETNPLENLLIEHPSMSVYHGQGRGRARSASPPHTHPAPSLPPTHPTPRQPLAPVTDQHALRCLELKAATKYQKKQSLQVNRNQLDRSNKVREVNSRGRRQRRSDRQQQHSGANNNRKCC